MSKWSNHTEKELERFKQIFWDDWNFGSGSQESYDALREIEEELEQRKQWLGSVGQGVTWHAANMPPPTPRAGDCFYNTDDDHAYIYDGQDWVVFSGPGPQSSGGSTG